MKGHNFCFYGNKNVFGTKTFTVANVSLSLYVSFSRCLSLWLVSFQVTTTLSTKMESKRIWIFVAVIAVFAASQGFYFPYNSQCLKITIKSLILQLCERSEPRLSLIFRAKNLHPQVHFLAPAPHITHPPVLRTSHPTWHDSPHTHSTGPHPTLLFTPHTPYTPTHPQPSLFCSFPWPRSFYARPTPYTPFTKTGTTPNH